MLIVKYGTHKHTIEINAEMTVFKLKQAIQSACHVSVSEQKLIFSGKTLNEMDKTLDDFGIVPSEAQTILLVKQIDTSRSIVLYVRTIQRELDFRLVIGISEKIETIRKMINEKVSLPSNYSLVYSGIVLQDQQTVLDYGIKERSSVYIVTQIVMEVENPTGERVKMRINDNRITGEVVERLVEQRRAVKSQRKRKHTSEMSGTTSTSTTVSASSRNAEESPSSSFAGYHRGGFLLSGEKGHSTHSHPRKRNRTTTMIESTTFESSTGSGDGVTTCATITSTPATTIVDPLSSNCNGTTVATTTSRVAPRPVESIVEDDSLASLSPPVSRKNCEQPHVIVKIEEPIPDPVSAPIRCFKCTKKVGLTAIKCRCSQHFCGAHRYPEEHTCSFDYRTKAKEELTKANPKVASSKVIPIGK
eukprot:TRINITY_DN412_c0_g1_i5.p1 TRINITY_DN412_c0_g1~~TRINITY_DN412_c0_g1_i5.p1  ORF type:complete len:417 (+),score=117.17 TRINITY_DN412_c0_g1_i5:751-2001(+)